MHCNSLFYQILLLFLFPCSAFFERIILCNSLVWSCAITGRSGMTFQEAEECEQKAKRNLSTFQDSLKKPLLYLATLTHRSRLNDLNDDIFLFAKDRFFIGETLDYVVGGSQRFLFYFFTSKICHLAVLIFNIFI